MYILRQNALQQSEIAFSFCPFNYSNQIPHFVRHIHVQLSHAHSGICIVARVFNKRNIVPALRDIVIQLTPRQTFVHFPSILSAVVTMNINIWSLTASQYGWFRLLRSGNSMDPWPVSILREIVVPLKFQQRLLWHGIPQFLPKPTAISPQVRVGSHVGLHFFTQILYWNIFAEDKDQIVHALFHRLKVEEQSPHYDTDIIPIS